MSKISQRQQMNVPIRTRNNEQVQTDVNLISSRRVNQDTETRIIQPESRFFEFVDGSWLLPFSDYYLLNQLNSVIQQLKNNTSSAEQYKTKKVIDELAAKIHGLLARQLKLTSKNGNYYDILLDKEKQITRLEIKYGNFEKKIDEYLKKIQELQREIISLRSTLKNYQNVAEENQVYKSFFREIKQITVNSKKVTDFEKILNEQILPKIKQYEINLSDVSKNLGRDRSSKQKSALSRYALELDGLSKLKDLSWETLSGSAAAFFTSIEHLNNDDWVQQRLGLTESYNQLRTRHIALLSLVSKNVNSLLKKDAAFKSVSEIAQFIKMLQNENKQGYETAIVNGWIGLGVIHCHRDHGDIESLNMFRSLLVTFQIQMNKLLDKYPQLNQAMTVELKRFISFKIPGQLGEQGLKWLSQIMVRETQVIHVEDVYNYYNKSDKQSIYYLRVLVKALVQQLKRISNNHKIAIQLDEAILQLIRAQVLDGINIDDIIALFKPSARVCEVGVIVQKPTYIDNTHTIGVPLKQQKAVIGTDISHFAVNAEQGVAYRKQIPYQLHKSQIVQVPFKVEKPYAVNVKIIEQLVVPDQSTVVVQVPVTKDNYIEVVKEVAINTIEQVQAPFQVIKEVPVPFHTREVQIKQVVAYEEVPVPERIELHKVVVVEQNYPKVYKEPKFEIVQRPVHHVVIQKEIEFIQVEKPIIEKHQFAKAVEVKVDNIVRITDHCDCQKPDVVKVSVEKPIYKQFPKQVVVEKCHFIQGGFEERIVQVACHTQVPIFVQVVKELPLFIQKAVPFRTFEEKLIIADRPVPFYIQHFTPIELIIEKPVIKKDIRHIPVEIEQPVPVYIEKVVPKVVEVFRDKIVQKIVEVPRVEIVEKIVQRIVTIPRIVERIVPVTQIVEVPVFIQTPVLEIIKVPVERIVVDKVQVQKIVEIKSQVLVVQKAYETIDVQVMKEVRTVIEVEPKSYPEVFVQKLVKEVVQKPIQIYNERIVDRVVHIKDVVAVPQRVEVPIQIQKSVQVIINQPIYYKQPIVQLNVQKVEREKLVQVVCEVVQIKQINKPYIVRQKEIVELPGQTIILKEPELHIVQVQKENIVHTHQVHQVPTTHYLYKDVANIIEKPEYITPPKEFCFFEKPVPLSIQKPVELNSQQMVVIERPDSKVYKVREGPSQQIVKLISNQTIAIQKQQFSQPFPVPDHHYHILYHELPPKNLVKTIVEIDQRVKHEVVTNVIEVPDTNRQVITKVVEIPIHMQRIFQRILMLPQIVEVEKKVYMIEEINSLIAKEVNVETHYEQYRHHLDKMQSSIYDLLTLINSGKQGNLPEFKNKLNFFLQLLKTETKIPKIVQTIKQVEVVREKDRPVLVPVYESEREVVLHCIINDLIRGMKGFSKDQLEKRFPQRIINLFAFEFGLLGLQGQGVEGVQGVDRIQLQSRWKSWLDNYDKNLPSTIPREKLTQAEELFIIGYDSKEMDYATIRASLQKLTLVHKQRLYQIERLKGQYTNIIAELRARIQALEMLLTSQKYYKDLYYNELLKIKKLLEERQYDQLLIILQRITEIREEVMTSKIDFGAERREGDIQKLGVAFSGDDQKRVSQLLNQLTTYESDLSQRNRQVYNLRQENDRLRIQIEEIKLGQPSRSKELSEQYEAKFEEWKDKIATIEQNHFFELNHLRDQLVQRVSGESTSQVSQQLSKNYEQLMKKYTELSQSQISSSSEKKNLISNYEEKIRDLNKQLNSVKRDYENYQTRSTNETSRIKSDYETKIASQSSSREKQLSRQIETLRRNSAIQQQSKQAEIKRIREEYEKKMTLSASNQQKELRKQLDQARRSLETAEQRFQTEKKRMVDDYEAKAKLSGGNLERELRRQIDQLKRNNESLQNNLENQKKRLTQQYENKLRSAGSSQERELRRQLDTVKKNYENYQKNSESQKVKVLEDNDRKVKQLQDDLERAKSARKGQISSPEQAEELQLLKQKIRKLEVQLDSSKKQIETYQKSRLGQTTYTSGIKQSITQDFQSPASKYRSGGHKFEEVVEGARQQQEAPQPYQRSSDPQKGRVSKSGVRLGERTSKQQQGQEIRSSSSRVSGGSQTSAFKSSMTMKEFMDLKKADDKDSILTLVMIKIIEKIQQQADKGIINSYTPNNIYLSNFNPNNLDSLIVRFGAPITNRKSKIDGLYLAPQVLRGEGTTLKSVVFTLAVIWDELIHYEIYYKKVDEIENLALEYKVRDTSLNPILRNTLFEMMSKDSSKRLELSEAKRRLSLQRYIVSQGRAGTTTSRVSTQSRKA